MKIRKCCWIVCSILGAFTFMFGWPVSSYAGGRIVVGHDDWTLMNAGFRSPSDPANFALNVAAWFTGGQRGRFLVYSDNACLTESKVADVMVAAGHTWVVSKAVPFTVSNLLTFDAVFLCVTPADIAVLTEYVNAGGHVYVASSGGGPEDAKWNLFLNPFGLGFANVTSTADEDVPIDSTHPIFVGVDHLYAMNGQSIVDLQPTNPQNQVLVARGSIGFFAVWESPRTDLVAYYPFNGNPKDGSGFLRDGIVHGATLTADRFGVANSAYTFNGAGDYIEASSTIDDVKNTFTMSMWFKTEDLHKGDRFANFLIQPSHGQTTWGDSSVGAGISAGTDKIKVWEHTHDYRQVVLEYAGTFTGWTLVTLVYTDRVPSLFVNGQFVAKGNPSPRNPVRPSTGHKLSTRNQISGFGGGETLGGDAYWFKGQIDDVRIYSRALASGEVTQLYQLEKPQPVYPEAGLVAHYPLDGDGKDSSGYGNHGIDNGSAWGPDRFGNPNGAWKASENGAGKVKINNFVLPPQEHTVTFWYGLTQPASSRGERMLEPENWQEDSGSFGVAVAEPGFRAFGWRYTDGAGTSRVYDFNTPNVNSVGKWYFAAITFKQGVVSLSINGQVESTGSASFRTQPFTLYIGGSPTSIYPFLSGSLDDLRVYNRALSADEVRLLYVAQPPAATPTIVLQPQDSEVVLGSTAKLNVQASGQGALSYQWRFNGARIIGATAAELVLENITASDFGDYTVQITDAQGSLTSKAAKLSLFVDSDGDGLSDSYESRGAGYLIIEGSFTWQQAKADAETRGGHLATITSESEWNRVTAAIGNSYISKGLWIGATDEATEGVWRWVTGEPWGYTRWNAGEPNNASNEDYAYIEDNGLWNDYHFGSVEKGYLLEFDYSTDPHNPDTDGDGYSDGDEVNIFHTLPNSAESKPTLLLKATGYSSSKGFRFSLFGDANATYRIEISTNLNDWVSLITIKLTASPVVLTDPTAKDFPSTRFYRAIRMP